MEFVDKAAQGFGYGKRETNGLVLATEEIFSFYERQAASGSGVDIELEDQRYRLVLRLSFRLAHPDMRAFNLTWNVNPGSEESLDQLGPMLAARSVSSLRPDFGANERVVLEMTRDRDYPPAEKVALPPAEMTADWRLFDPGIEDLCHFAAMAASAAPPILPFFLAHPGMAADMARAGHLNAILLHAGDWVVGGVLWRPLSENCLELYGPILFGDDPDDRGLRLLLDEAISRISRTAYSGLLRRQGPLAQHERFFDFLGALELKALHQSADACHYYYRQLKEDAGGVVYCQGPMARFVRAEYARLCLPRQVRETSVPAGLATEASVLAVELEYARSLATIRPLCAGKDMAANLSAHLDVLRAQGIRNFIVEIDSGRSEETAYSSALAETGFVPRLLIPAAGRGDILIYDHCACAGLDAAQ